MLNLKLEAPWYTYQKKIKALFEKDPEIIVGEIYEPDLLDISYAFDIEVRNHEKYIALDRLLPGVKTFGNVRVGLILYDEENRGTIDGISLYQTLFKGNGSVFDIQEVMDQTGTRHGYVRFVPEVVQFFDDDISDYNGNWSGLMQDIAREVFELDIRGVHFCTAEVNEKASESKVEVTKKAKK